MKAVCESYINGAYLFRFLDYQNPTLGNEYFIEDATNGTQAQNKAFHALVLEYWKSGTHSYNASSFEEFRNMIKRHLGEGFEAFIYVEMVSGVPKIKDAKTVADIPEYIKNDPEMKDIIRGRLKSWSKYTMKQRKNCIDALISEMHQAGVNTPKFDEILRGMGSD